MNNLKSLRYLFFFMSFFLSSVSAFEFQSANAREYITYEDFVHMDKKEKYETIQMVMEYITLLEGQGPKAEIPSKKFVQINPEDMKKIWNFFIQSAHANEHGQVFTPVLSLEEMQANAKHLCIYGGWVSFHDPIRNVCVHPSQITSRMKAAKVSLPNGIQAKLEKQQSQYTNFAKGACAGASKIACSPSYFGTEDEQGKAICVDGNASVGRGSSSSNNLKNVNTSLQCMLKVKEKTAEDGSNPILDRLIKNIESAEGAQNFSTNLQLMYSACLCGDGKFINESYNERIFLHRTCYGIILQTESLLKHLSSSNISCKELSSIEFSEIANMTDFTAAVYKSISGKFTAEDYAKFSKDDYNDQGDRAYIEARKESLELDKANGLCPIDFGYSIKLELKPLEGGKYQAKATPQGINAHTKLDKIKWEVGGEYKPTDDPRVILITQTDKEIPVKVIFDIGSKPTKEGKVPPLDKDAPVLTLEKESESEDGKTQKLKATLKGIDPIDPALFKWEVEDPGKITPLKDDNSKAVVPVLEKEYKVTVHYGDLSADLPIEPKASCSIAKTSSDDEFTTFTLTAPDSLKGDIKWSPDAQAMESPKVAMYKDYKNEKISVSIGTITCDFTPEEDKTDDTGKGDISIEAVTINNTNLEQEVKAIVKKDGKDGIPEGHTIKWFVKDEIEEKEEPEEEEEESEYSPEFKKAEGTTTPTPSDGTSHLGAGETTKVKKLDSERKVFAKLYDKDGNEVATSNELPVDKLKAAPPPVQHLGPRAPQQVQPMKFNRPLKGQRGVY